jgi:integrase
MQTPEEREAWPDLIAVDFGANGMAEDYDYVLEPRLKEEAGEYQRANARRNTAIIDAELRDYARHGAHLFRHSLATELLRSGATLSQIGQLLRRENHETTRIYAKVDIEALRSLSLPWPGGMQ